jgi:hypothetical protein
MAEATVTSHSHLRLEQASALCIRRVGGGAHEVVAIGDENFVVVTAPLEGEGLGDGDRHEVGDVIAQSGKKSDWEAVATDGEGRVFLIEEKSAKVVVVSADLREHLHTIHLRAEDGPDQPARKLLEGDNRGPEGMLLLAGGHLLVVKQREPVLLIEFGPCDDDPLGFGPDAQLKRRHEFELPRGRETDLFPLRSWELLDEEAVGSANDLAIDDEGRLHAISSRSRCIFELEPLGDREMVAGARWALPARVGADDERHAEGLAFDREGRPIVALDLQDSDDNVFVLERLARP